MEEHKFDGVIVPGLKDSHLHLGGWTATIGGLDLDRASDFSEVRQLVRRHAGTLIADSPVIGTKLNDTKLAEERLPTRIELDRMLEARPILLYRHCSHVAVANTAALDLAHIGSDTPDPPGGSFDRTASGEPTGVLRESAIARVSAALDPLIRSPLPEQLVASARRLAAWGILEIDCFVSVGTPMWCGSGNELEDLLVIAPDLPIEVNVFMITNSAHELRASAERIRRIGGRLNFGGWKGFADGSLGGRTAALASGYADDIGTGMLLLDAERDHGLARVALELGGGAAIHAIGDQANHETLELYSRLVAEGCDPRLLRIEHASLLPPDLIQRMADLEVVASVQPPFVPSDAPWIIHRVGLGARHAYPFRSMNEAGIVLLGGSDAPVESPNPWTGMAAARAHAISPAESIDAATALGMYGARNLQAGARADLLVIDRDPAVTERIEDTRVMAVWKDGRRLD